MSGAPCRWVASAGTGGPTADCGLTTDQGRVEVAQVNAYMAFIREVGFDDPTTRRILEDILKDTEGHPNELREMLSSRAETRR